MANGRWERECTVAASLVVVLIGHLDSCFCRVELDEVYRKGHHLPFNNLTIIHDSSEARHLGAGAHDVGVGG